MTHRTRPARPTTRHGLKQPARLWLLAALVSLSACADKPDQREAPAPAASAASASAVASAAASAPAEAETDAELNARFAKWLEAFRASALAAGITEATLHAAMDHVQLRHRAIAQDRTQPEFTRTLWDYIEAVVSPTRVATGQQKRVQYRVEADAASARYGVPVDILMAVWGIESNFGSNYGDVPVVDALATLGFEGRRETWARGQLIAALHIVQHGDMDAEHMVGSWAGAMGQTQFLPTSYLAYAVDADGDGRRDIWGSMADVLASTANFLASSGWRSDETWGTEVRLPKDFDLAHADPRRRQSSAQWAQEGLRSMDGSPLPELADASVMLPAGVRGPAFLLGNNYRSLLRYNNATSYALTVCLLAQAIGAGPGVQADWPRDLRALTRSEILDLQTALNQRGFDSGQPDGLLGPATRQALQAYQRSIGEPPDGFPTADLLARLQQGAVTGK